MCDVSRVNVWIRFAIMRNVVELDLDLWLRHEDGVQLPQSLFNCEKLKVLKLGLKRTRFADTNILHVPDSIPLPGLKVLHLRCCDLLNNASMRKLLCGAPVLEQLEIFRDDPSNMHILSINSCSLKSYVIQIIGARKANEHFEVVIDAPNLEFLELADCISEQFKGTLLTLLPSIVKAKISTYRETYRQGSNDYAKEIVRLLNQISNVKFLSLTGCILKKLNEGKQEHLATHDLITFHNLTHLDATFSFSSLILVDILEYMPDLEVFSLRFHHLQFLEGSSNLLLVSAFYFMILFLF